MTASNRLVALGDIAKDPITGFTGTVTEYAEFLHGCVRVALQSNCLIDDKVGPDEAFDIAQLELVEAGKHKPLRVQMETGAAKLGDLVKDPITGFTGTLVVMTTFIYGTVRVSVQSNTLDKDGKVGPTCSFNLSQLEVVEAGKYAVKPTPYIRPPGGPERSSPTRPERTSRL